LLHGRQSLALSGFKNQNLLLFSLIFRSFSLLSLRVARLLSSRARSKTERGDPVARLRASPELKEDASSFQRFAAARVLKEDASSFQRAHPVRSRLLRSLRSLAMTVGVVARVKDSE